MNDFDFNHITDLIILIKFNKMILIFCRLHGVVVDFLDFQPGGPGHGCTKVFFAVPENQNCISVPR